MTSKINFYSDVNECSASQCDLASTECINTPGGFHCKCRKGFAPNYECRPVGDLGLTNGGIPDDSITVSNSETGHSKEASCILMNSLCLSFYFGKFWF